MSAMERLGITREAFKAMYDEYNGFNDNFNKNHPEHNKGETYLTFLKNGSLSLVDKEPELVEDIINRR